MPEAQLKDSGSGLAPATEGWFVVNVRDAEWWFADSRGAACCFESEYGEPAIEFPQLGINVTVLEPGQSGVYHAESNQEAFLVLVRRVQAARRGRGATPPAVGLLPLASVDGARLRGRWRRAVRDPDGRRRDVQARQVRYPVSELAARYGASVEEETSDPAQVYATAEWFRRERPPYWDRLPWA